MFKIATYLTQVRRAAVWLARSKTLAYTRVYQRWALDRTVAGRCSVNKQHTCIATLCCNLDPKGAESVPINNNTHVFQCCSLEVVAVNNTCIPVLQPWSCSVNKQYTSIPVLQLWPQRSGLCSCKQTTHVYCNCTTWVPEVRKLSLRTNRIRVFQRDRFGPG